MFDISRFKNLNEGNTRYQLQINRMLSQGMESQHVARVAEEAATNLSSGKKSFVVYGEPQSGKTEMMIALTAQLLDKGHPIVIVLLNDNVELLSQNLLRFVESGIDPTPVDI